VLGPLELIGEGVAALTRPKERAVVAFLALRAGRTASVAELIDALWGDEAPVTAVKSLQSYVARARAALGREVLVAAADGYQLTISPDDVDVVRFERALASVRALRAEGRLADTVTLLDEAAALWRGAPDVELPESEVARAEAVRLGELHATALEDRVEARVAVGDAEWAVAEGERLVAEAPLRERRWGLLMTSLYAAGRQADALRAYQRARTTLIDELGIEPDEALRSLERRIIDQDPTLGASASAPPAGQVPPSELPSGTVTFLLTDIEGSTGLWDRMPHAMANALARHDELVATAVASAGGVLLKHKGEGDSTMSVFTTAAAAVDAALTAQRMLEAEEWPDQCPIRVRAAVSTGEVELRDGDYFGPAVNRAARIRSLASGRQILLGATTHALVADTIHADVTLTSLGEHELRGMARPEHIWELGPATAAPTNAGVIGTRTPDPLIVPFPTLLGDVNLGGFSGRDAELTALSDAWASAASGTRRAVLIAGEPGIGKTRLASQAAQVAHDDGAVVLYGRCDEDLAVPFQPFAEAVDQLATTATGDLRGLLGARPGELVRLSTRLDAAVEGLDRPIVSDPETERFLLFDAVTSLLTSIGGEIGAVLVLDDLHWASKPTLLLLRHVLRKAPEARLLVIGTYRDTDIDRTHPLAELLADLRREPGTERLALSGLEPGEVEAFVAAAAGHDLDDDARALAALVHAETSGNPLFVGEVLRHMVESGGVQRVGGRWKLAEGTTEDTLPEGVRDVIGRRLTNLSSDANEIAAWASVTGRDFRLDILSLVAGRSEDDLLDALDEALDARLVEETGPDRYRFSHAVVRAALYDELRTSRRVRMHRAVGEAYEAIGGDDFTALSHHFAEAAPTGEHDRAIRYTLAAAGQATTARAFDEAVMLHRRAIELLEDAADDDPTRRCDLVLELARAERLAGGDWRGAVAEAIDLARSSADGERLAQAALVRNKGWATTAFAVNDPFVALLEECLRLLPPDDSVIRAQLLGTLATELHYSGDVERIRRLADGAVDMATRLTNDDPEVLFVALQSRSNAMNGWPERTARDQWIADLERIIGLRDHLLDPASRWNADGAVYNLRWWVGRLGDAEADVSPIEAAVGPLHQWTASFNHAGLALLRGDLTRAEALANDALRCGEEAGEDDALQFWGNQMLFVRRQQGRADEAAALIRQVIESGIPGVGEWNTALTLLLCEADRLDEVPTPYAIAVDAQRDHQWDTAYLPSGVGLAFAVADLDDQATARWLFDQLEPAADFVATWGPISLMGPVTLGLGRLASCLGRHDESDEYLDQAVTWARDQRATYQLAEGLLYRATNLVRRDAPGDRDHALELLDECSTIAEPLGFGTILRRIERAHASIA